MSFWDFFAGVIGAGPSRFTAISREIWALKEEYKSRMKELEAKVAVQEKEITSLQEGEEVCQRRYQRLEQQYRDVKEELIFIKKQKP